MDFNDHRNPNTGLPGANGPSTTSTGTPGEHQNPQLQRIEVHNNPNPTGPITADPTNTWTKRNQALLRGSKIDPWVKNMSDEHLKKPSLGQDEQFAAQFAAMAQMDATIARWREKLFPKPWSAVVGGGIGVGLSAGTSGAATVHPMRCLLEGVHNPTSFSITFGLSDIGSGDPMPKFSMTLAAGQTQIVGTSGMLFERGITIITMTSGGVLTCFGRSLD